ncbi:MAG: acetyltransferase [bacterium]
MLSLARVRNGNDGKSNEPEAAAWRGSKWPPRALCPPRSSPKPVEQPGLAARYCPCPTSRPLPRPADDHSMTPGQQPHHPHPPPHPHPHTPSPYFGSAHHPGQAVVLIGGGGHATVIAEAARLAGQVVVGFLDDNPAAPISAILIDLPHPFPNPPHLGPLDHLAAIGSSAWIIALGDLKARRVILQTMAGLAGVRPQAGSVIHPSAFVSPSASIGPGVFIGPGAIVHARAKVAPHATVNTGSIVEHDCMLDENAHLAPGAILGGGVHVGRDTLIGLGSRVLPGVQIGAGCTIGAGSVVLEDVPSHTKVVGVPARASRGK